MSSLISPTNPLPERQPTTTDQRGVQHAVMASTVHIEPDGDLNHLLNALFRRPHPTHLSVYEAVAAAEIVGAERTFLTHLTHETGHQSLEDELPAHVRPAYDGLEIEI